MKIRNLFTPFVINKLVYHQFHSSSTLLKASYIVKKRLESHLITMKLDTPHFRNIFNPEINTLSDLFKKYGHELRMAGGAVRDLLMNKMPEDIDFATTATPEEMKNMFTAENIRMFNRKGESHGTVTCRINDKQNFEITTLRVDMRTDGRHAEVEFTKDWELDAGRRDLTINAMFLGLDGTLYDYFNGKEDLEKRRVKFVGDAHLRIQEDYLRILRYFRFYGRISLEPDNHDALILEAIRNNAEGLGKISGERVWMELKKILSGNYSKEILLRMIELELSKHIGLPDNPDINEFEKVCVRSQTMEPHSVTKLIAFLRNEDGVMTLHSRLKFSNYDRDLALFIVNNRYKHGNSSLKPYIILMLESKLKQSDTREWTSEVLKYQGDFLLWTELNKLKIPKFPISGHVLKDMGFKQGPALSKILGELKRIWIDSNFVMTENELIKELEIMKEKE